MFSQVNDGKVHRLHGCLFEFVLKRLCPSCQLMVLVLQVGWTPGSKREDWQDPEGRTLFLAYSVRSTISQSHISALRIDFPEILLTALVSFPHFCCFSQLFPEGTVMAAPDDALPHSFLDVRNRGDQQISVHPERLEMLPSDDGEQEPDFLEG